MKIPVRIVFISLTFILLIILLYMFLPSEGKTDYVPDSNINYENLNEVVFNVKTAEIFKGDLIKYVSANGLVKANNQLEIISNITGYINKIYVQEGKQVKKGELLVKFDDREQKIAISEAEVSLITAKIEYGMFSKEEAQPVNLYKVDSINVELKKLDNLFNEHQIDEDEYISRKEKLDLALLFTGAKRDEVLLNKSGMTNSLNLLNRAKLNYSYTEIIAPFNSVIADFNLIERQRVNAGEKLFNLLDISKLKVEVGILESEINKISIGSRAEIKLTAVSNKIYHGKVVYINPLIDTDSKTCRVTIELLDKDLESKPGMFAYVNIESNVYRNKVLIPKDALLVRDRRALIFVVEGDLAKWRYVTIGEQNDNYIELLDGAQPGEQVIVDGHYNLAHDSKIKVMN